MSFIDSEVHAFHRPNKSKLMFKPDYNQKTTKNDIYLR